MDNVIKQVIAVVVTAVLFAGAIVGFAWWKFDNKVDTLENRVNTQRVEFRADADRVEALLGQARDLVTAASAGLATDPVGLRQLVAEVAAFSERVPAVVSEAMRAGAAELQRATRDTLAQLKETADAIALTLRNAVPSTELKVGVNVGGKVTHNVHILQPLVSDLTGLLSQLLGTLQPLQSK